MPIPTQAATRVKDIPSGAGPRLRECSRRHSEGARTIPTLAQTAQMRDLVSAVEARGGSVRALGRDEVAERWLALCDALGVNGAGPSTWLWEMVESTVVRHIPDDGTAISEVGKLVGPRRCLVFFDDKYSIGPRWPEDPGYLKLSCVELEGATLAHGSRTCRDMRRDSTSGCPA